MLKEERLDKIVTLVDRQGTVKVSDIMQQLKVSDMTVRRDLIELENSGLLKKVHGGAQSIHQYKRKELSHLEKKIINIEEKKQIVNKALTLIQEGDTIFLGPGTTLEILAANMAFDSLRVVTNSLPVFNTLVEKENNMEVHLLGGRIRKRTQAFFGDLADQMLQNMHFQKTFISCNAIKGNEIMTASIEEGKTQKIALDNAVEKYLLVDDSKINKEDFYSFYELDHFTSVITNDNQEHSYHELQEFVQTILS
ncbi:DeoR/GlpR family DNA-binding transcription regulator [Enterococcus asini]|uniref:DeoR/GlpR family DNA-binding transcription regulator n=1 Tax=Enterococcus asini TaxID=57732 RepID=UPI00266BE4CB|nr:DeoR/GlpR family DNA-binding transcription regulator [Enterococcus asini]